MRLFRKGYVLAMRRISILLALGLCVSCKQAKLRAVGPTLGIEPAALDFGAVAVGSTQQLIVKLTNIGTGTVTLSGITFDGPAAVTASAFLNRDCQGHVREGAGNGVAAGECAAFSVTWAPKAVGDVAGKVHIASDDSEKPDAVVPVAGHAVQGALVVCIVQPDGTEGACSTDTTVPPLDFGAVAPSSVTTRNVRLKNTGTGEVTFGKQELAAGTATDFTLGATVPGNVLAPGAAYEVAVTFSPKNNGKKTGALSFENSDAKHPHLEIQLVGAVAGWKLCVSPDSGLDFGPVPVGQSRTLPVSLQNCGNVEYPVTSLQLFNWAPATHEYTSSAIPPLPLTLAPGAEARLDLTYTPTTQRTDQGSVDYVIDLPAIGGDPAQQIRDSIPLTGTGAPPQCTGTRPTAVILTRHSNGAVFDPATTLLDPLETITLDGSTSVFPQGSPQYQWRLVSQPANGNQNIAGGGPKPTLWMELAGDYVVELVVRDAACQSTAATVTLHVVPKAAVHVQLTWSQSYGDVDVHWVGPGGQFYQAVRNGGCSANAPCGDTFFAHPRPDWGCADAACNNRSGGIYPDGNPADDASLDIDQWWGNGPENINHNPFDGVFDVHVHYFCAHKCDYGAGTCVGGPWGPATPTVKIYVNGLPKFTKSIQLQEYQDWTVAHVTVTGGGTQISVADANSSPVMSTYGCLAH